MKKLLTACTIALLLAVNNSAFAANPRVQMETTKGTVIIELYPDKAPKTVENFLRYVKEGKYDDTIFHRVIKRFMNQGGGFTADFTKVETYPPITNEADNGLNMVILDACRNNPFARASFSPCVFECAAGFYRRNPLTGF